nr:immunoglobulin heavy chain junction region [Macaca mulatta]MOV53397.1 immunoglobulin heavy chain junction region [Macaca mulatta]MOV53408.1 immunoglobulin heavy chain junction region [Macaca mulatta]MOV53456.1 immunoglobulin heavy chain junction region [Macaca mulatta]MOV53458.1 immunoglobulin heavy chain junction region [Macaca mulatta]
CTKYELEDECFDIW